MSSHPLAKLRTSAGGLSQAELAHQVGVTSGMVSQWERWKATPRHDVAVRVDEALGADGAAIAAFGYMPPGALDEIRRLAAEVESLRTGLAEVQETVQSSVPWLADVASAVGVEVPEALRSVV